MTPTLMDCQRVIRYYFQTKTRGAWRDRDTYGFKHDFERYFQYCYCEPSAYVSEEMAASAFLAEGFTSKSAGKGSLYFNVSKKDWTRFHRNYTQAWENGKGARPW